MIAETTIKQGGRYPCPCDRFDSFDAELMERVRGGELDLVPLDCMQWSRGCGCCPYEFDILVSEETKLSEIFGKDGKRKRS